MKGFLGVSLCIPPSSYLLSISKFLQVFCGVPDKQNKIQAVWRLLHAI